MQGCITESWMKNRGLKTGITRNLYTAVPLCAISTKHQYFDGSPLKGHIYDIMWLLHSEKRRGPPVHYLCAKFQYNVWKVRQLYLICDCSYVMTQFRCEAQVTIPIEPSS